MQAFSRDLRARGQPLPATVSLSQLVSGGYISAGEVRAFDGVEVSISLPTDNSGANPQEILISARLQDGTVNALMADGSVQQLSAKKFREYGRQSGQPGDAANLSQPVGPETNQTSAAAGSGR